MKQLLLSILALLILNVKSYSQAVPNGGFELWNTTTYDEPNGWYTGNRHTVGKSGIVPVTKVAGQTGYALRIQTYISNGDTSDSYISNSAAGDPTKGMGGVPYSQQPTAITGHYRYNLPGNDSAGILVVFKKNAAVISTNYIIFRGTGVQNTFTAFSFSLNLSSVPDTVIIAAVASNLLSGVGVANGSWLEIDNLGFAGAVQPIPGGDFENWTAHSFETPSGWRAQGDSVYKTTDHYSGTYAVAMKTSYADDGRVNPSGITTGHDTHNGMAGGLPYSLMNDTLVGYYKYIPNGTDTANIFVSLSKNASPVGGYGQFLHAAANYTYFQMPFNAFTTPDSMLVAIVSSSYNNPMAGSILYIDGLSLKSMLVGMNETAALDGKLLVYPNPAVDAVSLQFNNRVVSALTIYDLSGRMVQQSSMIVHGTTQLNIAGLPQGIYTVEVKCGDSSFRSMFAKE